MKFFGKKIVASIAFASAMTILASPMISTVSASAESLYTTVQGNTTIGAYEDRVEAIVEAKRWANSKVVQGNDTVWAFGVDDNLYIVKQGNTTIGVYENSEKAIVEAKRWANSKVAQGNDTVWAFGVDDNLYTVKQGNTTIAVYENSEKAIVEAKRWANSKVVQGNDTVWAFGVNNNLYRVVQGNTTIGVYESLGVAIRETKKWSGSEVLQNDKIIWRFEDNTNNLYNVIHSNTTIGTYSSRSEAIEESRKFSDAYMIYNGEVVEAVSFARPTNGRVSSGFGPRWGRMHNGIDIAASTGTPIVASDSGVVTEVTYEPSGYGRKVVIDHQNGYRTLYAHASQTHVSVGQVVSAGDRIASVGSTGRSTGPHLHFEIIKSGRRVNPQNYL